MTSPDTIDIDAGDVTLVADALGDIDGPPVVLLHGGGQTRHAWGGAARRFAEAGHYAVSVDLRGHGDSGWSPDGQYGIDRFAGDVLALSATFREPPTIVAASLGGLSALVAIGEAPDQAQVASSLVMVDIAPRVEQEGRDHVRNFMRSGMEGFDSVDEAADAVAAYLPHRTRPADTSGLRKNLRERGGRWYWHWDPRWLTNTDGVDGQSGLVDHQRLNAAARALTIPVLLVRGQMSDIVSDVSVAEFQELTPHLSITDVAGAGHMVAGDRNDVFYEAVAEFIARQ